MNYPTALASLPLTVKSGAVLPVDITGQFVFVSEATDGLFLRLDDAEEVPAAAGLTYRLPADLRFTRVYLRNPHATEASVNLVYGQGMMTSRRARSGRVPAPLVPAPSIVVPIPKTSLDPSETWSFAVFPNRASNQYSLVALTLQNLSTTDRLLFSLASEPILAVAPGHTLRVDIGWDSSYTLTNDTGSVIPFALFYQFSRYTPLID